MLREALSTVLDCDQLIVTDDGSDFDVRALVRGCRKDAYFATASKMTIDERLTTPRLGWLINRALGLVTCDIVTYLCDDDLFHPDWINAVRNWFDANPTEHWTRGRWYQFQDGAEPGAEHCPLDSRMLTTGNFAHRIDCYRDEGIRWSEGTVACHDDVMLWNVHRVHNTHAIPDCGAVAGWRRLHAHNALSYTRHAVYNTNAGELFANGWME